MEWHSAISPVFWWYGIVFLASIMLTFLTVHLENPLENERIRNVHLHNFLSHVDDHTIIRQQRFQELSLVSQDFRFSYISREKIGRVDPKQRERFIVTGPREPFSRGKYTGYFEIMVADNSPQKRRCHG